MFGTKSKKEDLLKLKQETDAELKKIEDAEKKEQDARKKQAQQEERNKRELARKTAFYHLDESEPVRFLYFIIWLQQNPSLTVPYVDSNGAARRKTFTMQQLLDQWKLTKFCKNLESLKSE